MQLIQLELIILKYGQLPYFLFSPQRNMKIPTPKNNGIKAVTEGVSDDK